MEKPKPNNLVGFFSIAATALGRGRHSGYSYGRSYSHSHRIHRNREAKMRFEHMTGYPHGRKGYVVDHVIPLACGGADDQQHAMADDGGCQGEGQVGKKGLQQVSKRPGTRQLAEQIG
jgi:hypothetical protein